MNICTLGCPQDYDEQFECLSLQRFGHINQIRMDSSSIWTPNLNLYNGDIFDINVVRDGGIPIVVHMDGRVNMKRYIKIEASIGIITSFPTYVSLFSATTLFFENFSNKLF